MRVAPTAILLGLLLSALSLRAEDKKDLRVYSRIDLTAREAAFQIALSGAENRLEIRQIIVGRPQHAAAQIVITAPKRTMPPNWKVDVTILDIQSRLDSDSRLIITISDNVQIGKLEIVRDASSSVDPIVDIAMADTASASEVRLAGGHYRKILLRPKKSSRPAVIDIARLSLSDLTVTSQADERPQPLNLAVNGELTKPDDSTDNNLVLENLQLQGQTTIALTPSRGILELASPNGPCAIGGKSLSFRASRLMVGDSGGKLDRFGHVSSVDLHLDPTTCLTAQLTDINMFGDLQLQGGVLNKLALDNVDDHLGGHFELEFSGVQTIMVGSASLNRITLDTSDQLGFGEPVIREWGNVRVNESVSLPRPVYDALYDALKKSPDEATSASIRNFLVDVRWKSFSSEKPEKRAAPIVLFDVLDSDAHQIFGTPLANFLWLTTGYGQNVWHLIGCLSVLIAFPAFVSALWWLYNRITGRARWKSLVGVYYRALMTGDGQDLAQDAPRLRYVVPIHRLLIAIEIGLATLFIQNAILTGS